MRKGFTLLEVLVVLGITAIISAIFILNIAGRSNRTQLDITTRKIAALFREAQSRSIGQSSSTSWGVHFDNSTSTTPFFSLFTGTYATTTEQAKYTLPQNHRFASTSIPYGGTLDVTFAQLTGLPSAST